MVRDAGIIENKNRRAPCQRNHEGRLVSAGLEGGRTGRCTFWWICGVCLWWLGEAPGY